jgi:nucleoside-diphosphate-sugar epimerase
MKSFLISGVSGFIGRSLKSYIVSVLPNCKIIELTREESYILKPLDSIDVVIHLAGKAHDLKKTSNPQEYYEVNTELTKKIFDLFLISDAKTFVTLSSVKAVADSIGSVLTEQDSPNPQTHYGKSKRLAEEYILANLPQNKRVYILRPCMVHGEGNKGNLSLLYSFIKREIPYPLGAFDNQRSFLSVDNLCFVIKELVERDDIPSGIYHLADDEPISTRNLIKLIGNVKEKNIAIWNIPPIIIKAFAKLGDILPLPINTERLEKMTENYIVSNQKIKKALGKQFPLTSLEGLRKTITSFDK